MKQFTFIVLTDCCRYDFLAIGEKLKLKGLAKTPEHSASQVGI